MLTVPAEVDEPLVDSEGLAGAVSLHGLPKHPVLRHLEVWVVLSVVAVAQRHTVRVIRMINTGQICTLDSKMSWVEFIITMRKMLHMSQT